MFPSAQFVVLRESKYLFGFMTLFQATHFGNHEANRPGFERLYQKLSDQAWEDCIDLVKYNAKRGGYLENFSAVRETRTLQNLVRLVLYSSCSFSPIAPRLQDSATHNSSKFSTKKTDFSALHVTTGHNRMTNYCFA